MPVAARAAERTVVGSITKIDGMNLSVKTTDGKDEMVMLTPKTKVNKGKQKVDAKTLAVGDRVVAYGNDEKSMINAKTISITVAGPTTK